MNLNYEGIALVVTAVSVAIPSIGTFIVQMITLARQAANKETLGTKIEALSENLEKSKIILVEQFGIEKGRQEGVLQERANLMSSKP
jgi:hypothetical protein